MAEASDQATSVCNHCDRLIPISNIDSHYAYCSRNLVKCEVCADMVPRKLIEEHFLRTHASDTQGTERARGPRRRHPPEFSPKRLMYSIAVTGVAVLLGSVFIGWRGYGRP
ncbi:hypothetical protein DCAR_0418266 [Daucus carota subsp. sativus]|uniref:TRAF-type domain-containing protein n=1 Tax=Daucus carota subsp. sativus TaxID=79200 RepID=A0AAF0X397_DAUCS|nr:hypothetical protein DCAR_0418266 [Daucus carota subsp. sativus]